MLTALKKVPMDIRPALLMLLNWLSSFGIVTSPCPYSSLYRSGVSCNHLENLKNPSSKCMLGLNPKNRNIRLGEAKKVMNSGEVPTCSILVFLLRARGEKMSLTAMLDATLHKR